MKRSRTTQSGFSLIEVVVAIGVLGVLTLGTMSTVNMMNQQAVNMNRSVDRTTFEQKLGFALSNSSVCTCNIGSTGTPLVIPSTAAGVDIPRLKSSCASATWDLYGGPGHPASPKLKVLKVNVSSPQLRGGTTYQANLSVTYDATDSKTFQLRQANFNMVFEGTFSAGNYTIGTSCALVSGAGVTGNAYWTKRPDPSPDIYFNTGWVGIGNTAPASPMHISSVSPAGDGLRISNGVSSEGGQISLMDGNNVGGWEIDNGGSGATADFRLFRDKGGINTGVGMTIKADTMNVGIGTTAPTRSLVVASAAAGPFSVLRTVAGGNAAATGQVGAVGFGTANSAGFAENLGAAIAGVATENWSVGSARGSALTFSVNPNGSTTLTERMRIDQNGNVSIGTPSAAATLETRGTLRVSSAATVFVGVSPDKDISALNPGTSTSSGGVIEGPVNASLVLDLKNNNPDDSFAIRYSAGNTAAVDTIGFVMRGDGKVGIGVTPTLPLDVAGSIRSTGELISTNANSQRLVQGNYGLIMRQDGGNYYMLPTASGDQYGSWNALRPFYMNMASGNVTMGNGTLQVEHGGNVGVGTTGPTAKLHVRGTGGAGIPLMVVDNGSLSAFPVGWNSGIHAWDIYANGSLGVGSGGGIASFMASTGDGVMGRDMAVGRNFAVSGTSTLAGAVTMNSTANVAGAVTTTGLQVNGNGTVTSVMFAGAFVYTSDKNLKKNIEPIHSAGDIVSKLQGVRFDWKATDKPDIGFIAQDVENVEPNLVITNPETGMKGVKYGNVTALLVEALKENQEQVKELRRQVLRLENKLADMETKSTQAEARAAAASAIAPFDNKVMAPRRPNSK